MRSIKVILLIIVGVTAENCVYFNNYSGFVTLSPLVLNKKPVKIHMDVKANNCDDISLTLLIGNKYKYTTPILGTFVTIVRNIGDYEIDNPCNGLWHNVTLDLYDEGPLLHWNDQTFYRNVEESYNVKELRGETISIGFHNYRNTEKLYGFQYNDYDKTFEGSIRNITIDGVVQATTPWQINGTLSTAICPTDVIMRTTEGATRLNQNVTIDSENLQITFELKITDCPECCNSSAIILSAIGDDSYFFLEIVANRLYWKSKAGSYSSYHVLFSMRNYDLCNGKWHKIAVLQQGKDHKMIADNHSDSGNFGEPQHFTAPLYIGQHPYFKLLSNIEIRNGFKGCLRSLQINGVAPDMRGNDILNEFSAMGTCS